MVGVTVVASLLADAANEKGTSVRSMATIMQLDRVVRSEADGAIVTHDLLMRVGFLHRPVASKITSSIPSSFPVIPVGAAEEPTHTYSRLPLLSLSLLALQPAPPSLKPCNHRLAELLTIPV